MVPEKIRSWPLFDIVANVVDRSAIKTNSGPPTPSEF
jgi:hypothetical protein